MYSDLFLSPSDVNAGRNLTVKVTVQNTGSVDGYEVSVIHMMIATAYTTMCVFVCLCVCVCVMCVCWGVCVRVMCVGVCVTGDTGVFVVDQF